MLQNLEALLEKLIKTKNNAEKNEFQINLIKIGLRFFKEETEDMIKEEKETEKPKEIVNIVENILELNIQQ